MQRPNFHHIPNEPKFPYYANENPYAIEQSFDYSQWGDDARILVLNVPWNSDYKDTVYFESISERDAYIDAQSLGTYQLNTALQFIPGDSVKLPIPFDVMRRCNYICLAYPNPPVEYTSDVPSRFLFFVSDVRYISPSTTQCILKLDYWQTYIYAVHAPHMRLLRGHYHMATMDADTYLSNPLDNSIGLLADDFNAGKRRFQRSLRYADLLGDARMVVFLLPVDPPTLGSLAAAKDATGQAVSYSDRALRYGYQYDISGNVWNHGNRDYTDVQDRVVPGLSGDNINMSGAYAYAIEYTSAKPFLNYLQVYMPNVLREILACFVLPARFLKTDSVITLASYRIYQVRGKSETLLPLRFTKDDFGFDERYSDIAKLYTSPYSWAELFDTDGHSVEIRIEDTTPDSGIISRISLCYPALSMLVFADGIGVGISEYQIEQYTGNLTGFQTPVGDFMRYMVKHDIPTFSIYSMGYYETAYETWQDQQAAQYNSEVSYKDRVRPANTAYENACDSNDTAKANADRSADLDVTNTANDTNTANTNAALSATTQRSNTSIANTASGNDVSYGFDMKNGSRSADATLSQQLLAADAAAAALTNLNNTCGSIIQSLMTGNLLGAGAAIVGGVISSENNAVALSNDVSHLIATVTNSGIKLGYSTQFDVSSTTNHNNANTSITDNNATLLTDTTSNNGANANTKAANRCNVAKANSNATRNTGNANAGYSRDDSVAIAKRGVAQARQLDLIRYRKALTEKARVHGSLTGDHSMMGAGLSGVGVKVMTQSPDEIAQAGDYFLRYGIAANREIEFSTFNMMPRFTYWQTEDVRLNDLGGYTNDIAMMLESILNAGVTVWRNPADIGMVSIYDNR